MVDLHSHVLPALDDGPATFAESMELAREAARRGTRIMAATPHVRSDYEVDVASIPGRVDELNAALDREEVPLRVVAGAEVALTKLFQLDDDLLATACLGETGYLLVESPYSDAVPDLEEMLFRAQLRGVTPILAHPERSRLFQRQPERLRALVDAGMLTSVTAGSMSGRFGPSVRRFTLELFRDGLVHNVASDAHDTSSRGPGLAEGFDQLAKQLPGIEELAAWYTVTAPVAVLGGRPLPEAPELPRQRKGPRGWLKPAAGLVGSAWR